MSPAVDDFRVRVRVDLAAGEGDDRRRRDARNAVGECRSRRSRILKSRPWEWRLPRLEDCIGHAVPKSAGPSSREAADSAGESPTPPRRRPKAPPSWRGHQQSDGSTARAERHVITQAYSTYSADEVGWAD